MSPSQLSAKILRTERLADDVFRITLLAEEIARSAKPGQFVMVRTSPNHDPLLRRPFSIHQATADGRVQILVKVVGKGTRLLAEAAEGGQLDLVGPLGRGFSTSAQGPLCIIGGGIGIAPLFFLARELIRSREPAEILVLLGAKNSDELQPLADDFARLGLPLRLATDDGSLGHHGFVIDLMEEGMAADKPWQVYTCGPYPMLRGVAEKCAARHWRCQASLETMMACGISACLGCALPRASSSEASGYLHACKDGPVFEAREVLWL